MTIRRRRIAQRRARLSFEEIIPRWPDIFGRGAPIRHDLIGATLIRIGTVSRDLDLEGGGLIIDYVPKGTCFEKRLVLSFNELGMWEVDCHE